MTVWIAIECPHCHSTDVIKHGKSGEGKQRYLCQNSECPRRSFIRDYTYNGCKKEVDEMKSYVAKKTHERWLWHAIDHETGTIEERTVSKYKMQKIERKHLTLRTTIKRLQRKTICFSKISPMHDLVIGLYINKYEFHREII